MNFNDYLQIIEKRLEKSFDIYKDYSINNYVFDLFAKHNARTERYILTKKTVLDAMENNEYCLINFLDKLDENDLKSYIDGLLEIIDVLVKPTKEHMSSIITGVIVLDNKPSINVIKAIKRFKYNRGFAFGFKGWVDIRLILVAMKDKHIVTNKKGREVRRVYNTW